MRPVVVVPKLIVVVALLGGHQVLADAEPSLVGKSVANFDLPDSEGEVWSLADVQNAELTVVAFLGTECPLVQLYATRLNRIAEKYRPRGVVVVGIDSNVQDTADEIAAFAEEHQLTFPVLKDNDARVADIFGATRTPEVFLLDQSRTIRYHGRIDDQGMVGLVRTKADRHDLIEAIDELLAGKPVSQPELPVIGCLIGRRYEASPAARLTYSREIARIFKKRCVECHRDGEIGPFSMESYDDVVGWADMIREVVEQERMPPWGANPEHGTFSNDARLTDEEKQAIFDWVDAGAPRGDPADLPEPTPYYDGWNIGQPDQVVAMSDEPYQVPAEGVIPYQYYVVDPGFEEDKWLTACEVRPGNRAVVHHVLVFCKEPGKPLNPLSIFNGGLVAAYAPGTPAFEATPGAARRLPAGSKIVLQVHYTVNGRPQEDLTRVGFRFCDESEVESEGEALAAYNLLIAIPPRAENHQIKAIYRFREDRYLHNMTPHMHMRGKSFRFAATYPDGTQEILLDVPRFDFNWQLQYNLAEPKLMPAGTVLECTAVYDNSANNPANPNPNRFVTFGEQTWDEMMIGFFTCFTPPEDN